MTIYSYGFGPNEAESENSEAEFQLICDHLALILQHERDILSCVDYFFCRLTFAYASWPYIGGDGWLYLGYLLAGWKDGNFTGRCSECGNRVLVTSFTGSILSGSNAWTGICEFCRIQKRGRWKHFDTRPHFVIDLRKRFPHELVEWEECDGFIFSWGGNGLEPARKKRIVHKPLANPVSLNVLIEELKGGNVRTAKMPNVSLLKQETKLKFSRKR